MDEGSFSAAGRKLRRAQSVVRQTLANLQAQLGAKALRSLGQLPATHRGGAEPPCGCPLEALGGVIKPVLDRNCSIGVIGSLPIAPDELQSEPLLSVLFMTVASSSHPLAKSRGVVSASAIAKHGWRHMPLHMVKADLDSGALVKIRVEGTPRDMSLPMRMVFRKDAPPGPAARAFIGQLKRK